MNWTPHPYQKRGIKFIIERACAALLWDPGLGKTTTMLAAFKILKARGMVKRMLVITPLRPAYSVWPGEAKKWTEFNVLKVNVLHGPEKDARLREGADVDVVNPEGLAWLFSTIDGKNWPWDVICVDESTRFKHTNTQRFKLLRPHLDRFKRRYILTGSPAPNGLLDLFGQVYILDLGNALGRYITHFRLAYFDQTGYGGYQWVPKSDAEARIYKKLAPLASRLAAEDYLDLPPLIFNRVEVTLPDAAMKVYKQMETLLVASLKEEKVLAANAAAATNKCRQIANGGLYGQVNSDVDSRNGDGGERVVHHLHDAKVDAVEEIIEELQGKPALVAYEYDHDRDRLLARFGMDTPWIGGGVTSKRFHEIENEWNAGRIPILLAQPASVAHGLNLQGTSAAVVEMGLTWNLEDREQFIKRVWRQGQKEAVVVHSIVAKGTIDEVVMRALARKDRTQRALLDALKETFE